MAAVAQHNPAEGLAQGLERVMMRAGHPGAVTGLLRLSGGANMQSWRFELGGEAFVLRRAPSDEWVATRQLDMAKEAEVIRVARAGGVLYWLGLCQVLMANFVEQRPEAAEARERLAAMLVLGLTGLGAKAERAAALAEAARSAF